MRIITYIGKPTQFVLAEIQNREEEKMRINLYNLLVSIGTVAVFAAAASAQMMDSGDARLAGTWDAAIAITNCDTGEQITSFQSTANFNAGGTFTGITSGTPPANRSAEVGIWRHDRANRYSFRFKAYLFNPAGTAIAYQIVTHTLRLSKDNTSYTSSGDAKIFAMNGVQIGSGCSEGVGTRLTLD